MNYRIIVNSKALPEIKIDKEEIGKVFTAISTGNQILLKQGLFNPSYYIGIAADPTREMERETDNDGHYTGKLIPKQLEDIFAGIEELAKLKTADVKRLK